MRRPKGRKVTKGLLITKEAREAISHCQRRLAVIEDRSFKDVTISYTIQCSMEHFGKVLLAWERNKLEAGNG